MRPKRLLFKCTVHDAGPYYVAAKDFTVRHLRHESQPCVMMQFWFCVKLRHTRQWFYLDVRDWEQPSSKTFYDLFDVARLVSHNLHLMKRRMK